LKWTQIAMIVDHFSWRPPRRPRLSINFRLTDGSSLRPDMSKLSAALSKAAFRFLADMIFTVGADRRRLDDAPAGA